MNAQAVYQIVDQEVLYRLQNGSAPQRALVEWGNALRYYADGVIGLADENCVPEALDQLRQALAVGTQAAQQYGLPARESFEVVK